MATGHGLGNNKVSCIGDHRLAFAGICKSRCRSLVFHDGSVCTGGGGSIATLVSFLLGDGIGHASIQTGGSHAFPMLQGKGCNAVFEGHTAICTGDRGVI